ncbi:MAG: dienelactone hydrolase family protein [Armatimonadetes bacterium]|nr:dienelactone hydrolase family protein [Armatimonadota bacterium]
MQSGIHFLSLRVQEEAHRYALILPWEVDTSQPIPTILYLHGRGESGADGVRQLLIGLPSAMFDNSSRWPFAVVAPQKPTFDSEWYDQKDWLSAVLNQVDKLIERDHTKTYLTGLSQGGRGTFRLVKSLPWKFAAAAPICGWVDPAEAAQNYRETPIWAFHGEQDDVVKPSGSIDAIKAINPVNGNATVTLYPEANHNSWDKAYRESELPEWFLRHRLAGG